MTTQPDDPIERATAEPSADEIRDAERAEQRDSGARVTELRGTSPAKRGPGRPRGSKNKKPGQQSAREAGKTSTVTTGAPKLTGAAAQSRARADAARKAERDAQVKHYTDWMLGNAPAVVSAIGLATGIPQQFLVGLATDATGRPIDGEGVAFDLDPATGQPPPGVIPTTALTHYGEALAPKPWQVRTVAEAGVRFLETDQGEKLAELVERLGPYMYGAGALAALGLYTVTVLKTVEAIKPMVAIELQKAAEAAAQQAATDNGGISPEGPHGSSE